MSDYDFKSLNDKEFEIFCADILSDTENVRFERFKPGKDGGVDGRYFKTNGTEVLLQCKHWANTPIEQLIRHLKIKERQKLDRLRPDKYILAVSNQLSRNDKAAIQDALSPYIKNPSDIFGREDLNDLLRSRPNIERRHYKLWLCSASVLTHIVNKPIFDRSAFSIDEIFTTARKYVVTENHDAALDKLDKLHVVIITGEPGIGKTTLAEHLCLHYVSEGFQLFKISNEIHEAESVFERDTKQIFYFDDFLGRNYLQALSGHEGNQIAGFIRRVKRDANKRFILTSRSTILNQGKMLIDNFTNQNIDKNEFELKVSSLCEMDRAKILYNHLWHSGLESLFIDELYKDRRYRNVIDHRNFNPRLISFLTDMDRLVDCPSHLYWTHVTKTLENPADVWENPFVAQQDDFGRAIVILVTLNGRSILQDELSEAYSRYISHPQNVTMSGRKDFLTNLRHLTGSLINRHVNDVGLTSTRVDLFNPSIGDFVLRRLAGDAPTLRNGFVSLRSYSSLETLSDLLKNKFIDSDVYARTLKQILVEAAQQDFVGYSATYIANAAVKLIKAIPDISENTSILSASFDFVKREEIPGHFFAVAQFFSWAQDNLDLEDEVFANFILGACCNSPNSDELFVLIGMASALDDFCEQKKNILHDLDVSIVSYLEENIHDEIDDSDVFDGLYQGDYESAENEVERLIDEKLDTYGVRRKWSDVKRLIEAYDVQARHDDFFSEATDVSSFRGEKMIVVVADEIDDLFERS